MLWLKALHIIFMVCWFAGLFYLPRILVYFAASEDAATRQQLAVMARKLYRFVTPFLFLTAGFGIALIVATWPYTLHAPWLWIKLAAVLPLFAYHWQCGRYVAAALTGSNRHSHVYFRFFNEVPVLFLFAIVILAVVKPNF
jgi:putative membrane protein